jgi:phosphoribosyl 1,2-cyclic phosphate phosphodiesterase
LVDTPEEIKDELNRSHVTRVAAVTYSHWHPDHTSGRRVLEEINIDWRAWPRAPRGTTDVFLPEQVAVSFREWFALWDHFEYMQDAVGTVVVHELTEGQEFVLGETIIRPVRLAEDYVYAFLLREGDKRALVAPDELHGWVPPAEVRGVDVAVLPMGIAEFDPLTGRRLIHEDHRMLQLEATFDETLEIVQQLEARKVYLTHIEEMDQLGYDDLKAVEAKLGGDELPISFAYDTLVVDV